jgi:hypothetical protein
MDSDIFKLCDLIREASFQVHSFLRHGHLEKVYENGMTASCMEYSLLINLGSNKIEIRKFFLKPIQEKHAAA